MFSLKSSAKKIFDSSSSDDDSSDESESEKSFTDFLSNSLPSSKIPNSGLSKLLGSVSKSVCDSTLSENRKVAANRSTAINDITKIDTHPTTSSKSLCDDLFVIDKSTATDREQDIVVTVQTAEDQSESSSRRHKKTGANKNSTAVLLSSTLDDDDVQYKASKNCVNFDKNYKNVADETKIAKSVRSKIDNKRIDEIMKKSVITPEFHKLEKVPPYRESMLQLKKQRKAEREKTKGEDWFDLPATEMTEERKRDLEIMKIRDSLDPKSFYRKDDRKVLPKYFQIGTVIENPTDFYSDRIPKKQRKQTIVEELLADADFQKYHKEKYKQIVAKKEQLKRRLRPKKTKSSKNK